MKLDIASLFECIMHACVRIEHDRETFSRKLLFLGVIITRCIHTGLFIRHSTFYVLYSLHLYPMRKIFARRLWFLHMNKVRLKLIGMSECVCGCVYFNLGNVNSIIGWMNTGSGSRSPFVWKNCLIFEIIIVLTPWVC